MTIPNETSLSGPYNGNGVTTAFDYEFRIADESHVLVLVTTDGVESALTIDADYSVTGVGDVEGQVILNEALASGSTLVIVRNVPFNQPTDLENHGAYYAETVERAFDLAAARDQQLKAETDRSIKLPFGQVFGSMEAPIDGRLLVWDASGDDPAIVNGPSQVEIDARLAELTALEASFGAALASAEEDADRAEQALADLVAGAVLDESVSFASFTGGLVRQAVETDVDLTADDEIATVAHAARVVREATASTAAYRVAPDRTIEGPDGERFIVRGVTMFDYLFTSFEYRTDWTKREVAGQTVTAGGGTPTGFAPSQYVNAANVRRRIRTSKSTFGTNLIRVAVEPAMVNSTGYSTYPSDMDMLDTIVAAAGEEGVVVQIHNGNGENYDHADVLAFLTLLATRYRGRPHVWLCPMNEPHAGMVWTDPVTSSHDPDVYNSTLWGTEHTDYVAAIRGAGFTNPIAIHPTLAAHDLNDVHPEIQASATLKDDPNLVIGIHVYPVAANGGVYHGTTQSDHNFFFGQYLGFYPIFIDETGIDNYAGRYDPTIDPGQPLAGDQATQWPLMQQFMFDFLESMANWVKTKPFSGCTAVHDYAHIPGLGIHDDNTLFKSNGTLTTWANIFLNAYCRAPAVARVSRRDRRRDGEHGGCILTLPTTSIRLNRCNGAGLIVSGRMCVIPAAGVSLAATGLSVGGYYIYAHDDNEDGVIDALIASATAPTEDTLVGNDGVVVMTGNRARTLVGYAEVTSGPVWSTAGLGVLSYFNRRLKLASTRAGSAVAGPSNTNWTTAITQNFPCWPDEHVSIRATGAFTAGSGPVTAEAEVLIDSGSASATVNGTIHTGSYHVPFAIDRPASGLPTAIHSCVLRFRSATTTAVTVQSGALLSVQTMG